MKHGRRGLLAGIVLLGVVLASSCGSGADEERPAPAAPVTSADHRGHSAGPAASPAPLRRGERFVSLSMPRPYTPVAPNGGTDEYRCFLVDPGLTSSAFLTGSQFLPQNADLVHHAIFFRIDPAQVPAARQVDTESPGEGWTCFGNAGIAGTAAWVAHWAPGTGETLSAAGTGYPMPPGSRLVMQVHYNLLGSPGGPGATDRSGIRLRLTERAGLKPLNTMLLMAPVELACAADESGPLCDREAAVRDVARRFGEQARATVGRLNQACHQGQAPATGSVQQCDHYVQGAGAVYAVGGHMHLLGRSITVDLNPARPEGRRLLDVPAYNFDEQAVIALPEPIAVNPGDTLRVTCTHDATLRQRLPQLQKLPPRYVVWGEGTSDEMCLGLVVWSPIR
jgi:hypothetical protein